MNTHLCSVRKCWLKIVLESNKSQSSGKIISQYFLLIKNCVHCPDDTFSSMWAVLRTMRLTTKTTQELPLQCERAHQPVLRISLIQISSICGMSRNKSRPQDSNDPTPTPQQAPCTSKSQPSPINGGHPAVTAHPTAAWSWNCLIFLTKLYFLHFHKGT